MRCFFLFLFVLLNCVFCFWGFRTRILSTQLENSAQKRKCCTISFWEPTLSGIKPCVLELVLVLESCGKKQHEQRTGSFASVTSIGLLLHVLQGKEICLLKNISLFLRRVSYVAHFENEDNFLETQKTTHVLITSVTLTPYKNRPEAAADCIELLWNPQKNLQGTGPFPSLQSIVSLLYLYCREDVYSARRNRDLVLPLAKSLALHFRYIDSYQTGSEIQESSLIRGSSAFLQESPTEYTPY